MGKHSETFRKTLAEIMEAKGLTQSALAAASGITQPQLSNYLIGRASPGIENLVTIAIALDVSTDELLGMEPIRPPPPNTYKEEFEEVEKHLRSVLSLIDRTKLRRA